MKIKFYKYEGTGNDFIIIDNRDGSFVAGPALINALCHRKTGIGADGLMLLEEDGERDFRMHYFNADGGEVAMCGNGGRCIALFAHHIGIGGKVKRFNSMDGPHDAEIIAAGDNEGLVRISLTDVYDINLTGRHAFLNTGVPHVVRIENDVMSVDVEKDGAEIRYSSEYEPYGGANANFAEVTGDGILKVRTYERGVEGETLACGTGAAASAIAVNKMLQPNISDFSIDVPGGMLKVSFKRNGDEFTDVKLEGPVRRVYEGFFDPAVFI